MTTHDSAIPRYRWMPLLALLVCVGGIVSYPLVLNTGFTGFPWFVPLLVALGTGLALLAWQKRVNLWRSITLLLCLGLLGLVFWFLFIHSKLPSLSGTVAQGQSFKAFEAKLADGTALTTQNFQGETDSILVFYRGLF